MAKTKAGSALSDTTSFINKQKGSISKGIGYANEQKAKVMGSIAAVQTLLNKVSAFVTETMKTNGEEVESSFSFMLNILSLIGITEQEIIEWVAKLLAGKGTDGFLNVLEESIKAILLANVKKMFTCSMNPFIPDKLMEKTIGVNKKPIGGEGIAIDLDAVDTFGILNLCPVNDNGKDFYFDAKTSDYVPTNGIAEVEGYTVNELWKSRDFNAYLWYVINKGTRIGVEANKLYWDNRVKFLTEFTRDSNLKEKFFAATYSPSNISSTLRPITVETVVGETEEGEPITEDIQVADISFQQKLGIPIEGSSIVKQQIIKCEYVEHAYHAVGGNMLKVYINPNRYYAARQISLKIGSEPESRVLWVNKTVFEFNYDYIYSLKFFNTRTLVASIINAVVGLVSSISVNFSIKKEVNAQKVRGVVNSIIIADDNSSGDGAYGDYSECFYKFSNDEYDKMLEEAIKKHAGVYNFNGVDYEVDYDSILKAINDISDAATPEELQAAVSNALTTTASSIGNGSNSIEYSGVTANTNTYAPQISLGLDIIKRLLEETVTQIVMQVLTPKVAILYKVNSVIMGDVDPESDGWDNFMKDSKSLIVNLVLEIKSMLVKQMMQWILDELKPLLELFASKVVLEATRDYRELLTQLLTACGLFGGNSSYKGLYGDTGIIDIGDVYGADITPSDLVNNNPEGKNKKC